MDPKERNRIQLKKGLQQLPQYQAPAEDWDMIQRRMAQEEKDVILQSAIKELPAYQAPDEIWDKITAELPSKAKVRRLNIIRWVSAAAIVGICGLWLFNASNDLEEPVFAESIKYEQIELSPVEWKGDDPAVTGHISRVLAAADQQPAISQQPQVQAIKGSLEKITVAIAQVEQAGQIGGMNEQMQHQLTKMFIKRNQLVRQLASEI